ncbi:MAG: class I SAM-dependent methyltransferase [Planctomycetota bacterium]
MNTATIAGRPDLLRRLHHVDPYEGFDPSPWPLDLQGWNGQNPFFGELIAALDPKLVIEVGTWKGQSAVTMAKALQLRGPGRALVCVDTWLGAVEFIGKHDDPERALGMTHGYPSVYYQFLANVVHEACDDVIVPFAQTSVNAARWFLQHGVQADLIYIDGSHEENDVFLDLTYYWQVAKPGAVLFGDDLGWAGVHAAVAAFAAQNGIDWRTRDGNYWVMQKG